MAKSIEAVNPIVPEGITISYRLPLALFVASVAAIAGLWWWLATPMTLSQPLFDPAKKLDCISYAPFRPGQTPFDPNFQIPAEQIAEDLAQLAKISRCVRTYSVDVGLDQVPALARKAGLKVIQGIWLMSDRSRNQQQINRAVALTKEYPDVITSLVVGNEVLLRGEMNAADLTATLKRVRNLVRVPITYADVWEFWLRNRDMASAVDFVTIHILPFWEDFPVRARHAAAHVLDIRNQVAVAFPGKEILIGETGWPSAGRMRDGALPSRTNQARVVSQILDVARRQNFRVSVIEAYDQPWKRYQEGTVGGHWGLFTADARELKYPPGEKIGNYPLWPWQLGGGILLCFATFASAFLAVRRRPWQPRAVNWLGVGLSATVAGMFIGIAAERVVLESLGWGGWLQWGTLLAAAIAMPPLAAYALMRGQPLPTFVALIGPRNGRTHAIMQICLGIALLATVVIATAMALGFVFDPRYRDFPYAPLTVSLVPMMTLLTLNRPAAGQRPIAEAVFAGILTLSAGYIAFNESYLNWQSVWTCAVFFGMALTLWQARAVQIPAPKAQSQSPTG